MSKTSITFPMFGENFSLNPPTTFNLFGLSLTWYGAIIAFGFLLAVIYVLRRSDKFGLTQDNIIDSLIFAVPIGIVGARLYYVIFNFSIFVDNPIDIFKTWEGGLAVYGGIIFSVLTVYVYGRIKKIPFGALMDVFSLGLLIGQAVGRWANFINREAFGALTDVPWKMGLTLPGGETMYVHPTFLYESLWNFASFILLHILSKRRKYDGQIFISYITLYGLGRFIIEGLRSDSLYLFNTGIRVSQLVAALSFAVGIILLIRNHLNSDRLKMLYADKIKSASETSGDEGADTENQSDL